jgi:hypothetical protein
MRNAVLATLALLSAACGGSSSSGGPGGGDPFVPVSVFVGSCEEPPDTFGKVECIAYRQNSEESFDVKAALSSSCTGSGSSYSAGMCQGTWQGCCLYQTPGVNAGDITKTAHCEKGYTQEEVDAYLLGCTNSGGTPSTAPPDPF